MSLSWKLKIITELDRNFIEISQFNLKLKLELV